ncbi:MAG TPA: hypothetical protein VF121_08310 [Thermoanaerobaculia bacterium]|nr:hypothetical protein [Thermoanaerobaculia bacterium]
MARAGIFDYIQEAFKVPYNVILLAGGVLAGVVTMQPLVVWPLVAAVELVYLLGLSHNPRFQNLVRARRDYRKALSTEEAAEQLVKGLNASRRQRFDAVRDRCRELQRSLAAARTGEEGFGDLLGDQQTESVNKLLWVFLRTLAYEQMLDGLCTAVPKKEIEQSLQRAERDQATASEPLKAALAENVEVLRKRLENLQRAEENLQGLRARLVRIENSILLVQEQALTRRDPAFVEAEVKAATVGLDSVEEVLRGMDLPPIETTSGTTPEFLRREAVKERA